MRDLLVTVVILIALAALLWLSARQDHADLTEPISRRSMRRLLDDDARRQAEDQSLANKTWGPRE